VAAWPRPGPNGVSSAASQVDQQDRHEGHGQYGPTRRFVAHDHGRRSQRGSPGTKAIMTSANTGIAIPRASRRLIPRAYRHAAAAPRLILSGAKCAAPVATPIYAVAVGLWEWVDDVGRITKAIANRAEHRRQVGACLHGLGWSTLSLDAEPESWPDQPPDYLVSARILTREALPVNAHTSCSCAANAAMTRWETARAAPTPWAGRRPMLTVGQTNSRRSATDLS